MNCSGLVHKWNDNDKDLIFEGLSTSRNFVYARIGKNEDKVLLMFVDIEVIKAMLKRIKDRSHDEMSSNFYNSRYITSTEQEFRRARKLLKQVNSYIQK